MTIRSLVRLVRHGLVLSAAVLALSGCDVMVGVGGLGGKEVARDQWTRSYPLAEGGQVEIINVNGAIQAEAADGAQVDIVAERSARAATVEGAKDLLQRIVIREDTSGGGVRLSVEPPSGFGGGDTAVEFKVKVPRTAAVRLVNKNGKVTVIGVQGAVRADVSNGGVIGRGLGGTVDANTANGSVSLDIDTVPAEGIRLGTTNGAVQLTLPASAKADLRASCVSGSVNVTNLALEYRVEKSRRRIDARLNGGGPRIDLATTHGGVKITGK